MSDNKYKDYINKRGFCGCVDGVDGGYCGCPDGIEIEVAITTCVSIIFVFVIVALICRKLKPMPKNNQANDDTYDDDLDGV